MLKKFADKTALKLSFVALLAVFFSTPSYAEDQTLGSLEQSLNGLVTRLARSVVTVEASHPVISDHAGQAPNDAVYNLVSTGIVYDTNGYILTVASSVTGRSSINIRYEDKSYPASIVAIDYQNGIALLRCSQFVGEPVRLNRNYACSGQMVLAMGSAYGMRATPSMGFCAGMRPDGIMQFTAMITSGTMGGGLFNLSGELVGIISGGIGGQGKAEVGLAVPADSIPYVVRYLLLHGDRPAGYLGLNTDDIEITPPVEIQYSGPIRLASSAEKPLYIDRGILINSIVPNSPAARAGLRSQDLMFAVGNQRLTSALDLADLVRHSVPGTVITLGILRQNSPYYIQVRIGESHTVRPLPDALDMSSPSVGDYGRPSRDSLLQLLNQLQLRILFLENRVKQLE